jgi:hypothetical protein
MAIARAVPVMQLVRKSNVALWSWWWIAGLLVVSSAAARPSAEPSWTGAEAEIAACFSAMDNDPALATINAKFARGMPDAAQLADRDLPSEEEAEALRLRVRTTRQCRDMRLAAVHALHPQLEPAYATLYYRADQVFQYLTNRLVTYGTANRLASESLAAFQERSRAYFAAGDSERRSLAERWSEQLQRAHSNPPPPEGDNDCRWVELNLSCDRP